MIIEQTPANPGNYTKGRGGKTVTRIVEHVADGSYRGSIAWFQDPKSNVSAHFIVSSAGEVAQCVSLADTAWQAGDFSVNQTTVGIEHEGRPAAGPWTPTEAQLLASAELTAQLCQKYGITPNRATIIPHSQINPLHNCPGPTWPWERYLSMVTAHLTPAAPLPPAHAADPEGKRSVRLFDPATNEQVGTGTLIVSTDKVYIVPTPK